MNDPPHTLCDITRAGLSNIPVDNELLKQRKCRTQALKGLLSIPPESPKTAPGTWRLAYVFAALRSRLQIKLS